MFSKILISLLAALASGSIDRRGKYFSLFPPSTILRFDNYECGGITNMNGTCLARRECRDLDGTAIGDCASRRGICCLVQRTCGGFSNINNTYFTSFGYPTLYQGSNQCSVTIERCNPGICQLRIDLLELTLAEPNSNGTCTVDQFNIIGSNNRIPQICGLNGGQHIYANFNGRDPIVIMIRTNRNVFADRRWNMKISQIACTSPNLGCLMYYTGRTGTVKSFNYDSAINNGLIEIPVGITRELANLNYGICVRMEAGYCSIRWSQTSDRYSFTVSSDTAQTEVLGTTMGFLSGASCLRDYVMIPNAYMENGTSFDADRFCGIGFPVVISSSKPFVLHVVTDENDLGNSTVSPDIGNRGFTLTYEQVPC